MRNLKFEIRNSNCPSWAYLLWPLGALFLGVSSIRSFGYPRLRRPIRLGKPTLSVGNLTFGGTGKTPMTIHLAGLLREMGERPAVLLRGYGRTTRGALAVGPDDHPERVGEEALLIARSLPGLAVAVGERREEAAALVSGQATCYILDDAFQHLRVHRDLDILLVDASSPSDLHAPPVGRLREPIRAARRAHAMIVTRGGADAIPTGLQEAATGIPRLGATFEWAREPQPAGLFGSWADLAGAPLVAFAGIGNPRSFFAQLHGEGLEPAVELAWPDHAAPSAGRWREIVEAVKGSGARAVLTTAKDAVKWEGRWSGGPPLVYPRLDARLDDPDGVLPSLLQEFLRGRP